MVGARLGNRPKIEAGEFGESAGNVGLHKFSPTYALRASPWWRRELGILQIATGSLAVIGSVADPVYWRIGFKPERNGAGSPARDRRGERADV